MCGSTLFCYTSRCVGEVLPVQAYWHNCVIMYMHRILAGRLSLCRSWISSSEGKSEVKGFWWSCIYIQGFPCMAASSHRIAYLHALLPLPPLSSSSTKGMLAVICSIGHLYLVLTFLLFLFLSQADFLRRNGIGTAIDSTVSCHWHAIILSKNLLLSRRNYCMDYCSFVKSC